MTTQQLNPARPTGWLRLVYLILVVALFATVITVWFQTPQVRVESATANAGPTLVRCANAGSSRWDSPTVRPGQELVGGVGAQTTNLSILKNDLESLRVALACDQARSAHTDTLVVTTFGAATLLFFGYVAFWRRRLGVAHSTRSEASDQPPAGR